SDLANLNGLDIRRHPALDAATMAAALAGPAPPMLIDASPGADVRRRARRLWRVVALAALLALLVYPLLLALGNARLDDAREALTATNAARFATAFPDIKRVVNPRVQADQAIATLRAQSVSGPAFLDLLADLDAAHHAGLGDAVRVRSIAFSAGVLEVNLETTDMSALERVRNALGAAGLRAEMLSAESIDDGVLARLRVGEGS
ncbi:MAG: type II secretion system protein GspL, partial [Gammaproteobacteria bacterium]